MNKVGGDKNSDERESSTSFTVCQSLSLVLAYNAHTHTFTTAHRPMQPYSRTPTPIHTQTRTLSPTDTHALSAEPISYSLFKLFIL